MQFAFSRRRRLLLVSACSVLLVTGASLLAVGSASARARGHASRAPSISSRFWGTVNFPPPAQRANLYTLRSGNGMTVTITNYGGVVQTIRVPNRNGGTTNVALGFKTLSDYVNDFTQGATQTPWPLPGGSGDTYFGAIIGRYANRIANASFTLNGKTYTLDANNGTNTLHGGYLGWNTKVWTPSTSVGATFARLRLTALMPAGEGCLATLTTGCNTPTGGFPASVLATVTYTLTRANALRIDYKVVNTSTTDATVINLTNHTYFNLGGEASGTVYDQLLALNSDRYTPVNTNLIPESPFFVPVGGTPFDFRTMHPIGQFIRDTTLPDGTSGPFKQLQIAHGYDHNWVLNGYNGSRVRLVSVASDPSNGVALWTYTDQPGVQVYTGNFLVGDLIGTSGHTYRQSDAFTLETQHYPDTPHHIGDPAWPSVVLNAGGTFTSTTSYKFTTVGAGFRHSF
ncbi:MAG: galactose mutarotase [Solirubrobacterales bacterium]|nr:galactose mutarotase [Solirubrobacterales bacterium]